MVIAEHNARPYNAGRTRNTEGASSLAPSQTHPWRLRDARTGSLLLTYVAEEGQRLLQVPAGVGAAAEEAPESQRFHGENDTGEVGYGAGMDDVDGQVCRVGAIRGCRKGPVRGREVGMG